SNPVHRLGGPRHNPCTKHANKWRRVAGTIGMACATARLAGGSRPRRVNSPKTKWTRRDDSNVHTTAYSMIRKSGSRLSEKIMLKREVRRLCPVELRGGWRSREESNPDHSV